MNRRAERGGGGGGGIGRGEEREREKDRKTHRERQKGEEGSCGMSGGSWSSSMAST